VKRQYHPASLRGQKETSVQLIATFSIICWPLIVSGVLLCALATKVRQPLRRRIGILAILLIAVPIALLEWFYEDWVAVAIDQDIFFILLGSGALYWALFYSGNDQRRFQKIFAIVFGICGVGFGSYFVTGDFLLPRRAAIGVVERVVRPARHLPEIYIDGQRYNITNDLLVSISVGQRILIQYGVSSKIVFLVKPLS
jgi:hypothetical protein